MMRGLLVPLLSMVALSSAGQEEARPFQPFQPRAYRLINGVAFDANDSVVMFALLNRDVLAHRGRPDSTAAELGLFQSRRQGAAWSEPALMPFSGSFPDYEPALSPDGSVLLFNSKRPYADGRAPARNDLFFVARQNGVWGQARPLSTINSFDLEESYATIDRERRVIFVRGPSREGTDDYDLFETRLGVDHSVSEAVRLPFSDAQFGEGDPQVAHDGSFVIFTRWDHRIGWQQTCDLFISFRTNVGWTIPVALTELNTTSPDYAAALSTDGQTLYYRAGGRYLQRQLAPILDSARARTR